MSDYFNLNDRVIKQQITRVSKFKKFIKSKLGKKLIFILVALVTISLTVILSQKNQDYRSRAQLEVKTDYKQYSELLREGRIKPVGQILEVDLFYERANEEEPLKVLKLKKKNGFAPKPEEKENDYSLIVKNDANESLYTLPFSVPAKYSDPPSQDGNYDEYQQIELDTVEFSLTLPYFASASEINIEDKEGEVILAVPYTNIEDINNTPNFNSIKGDDFQKTITPLEIERTEGPTDQFLNITFIGDKYTSSELDLFHNDVNDFIDKLLDYEPFLTRNSQIIFHYVDNIADLGCYHYETMTRLIICNDALVIQEVNNNATPYDKIVVIVKDTEYGGSGGGLSVAYNGSMGSLIFVHEFGHSFGGLLDEYVYSADSGLIDNVTVSNCYSGNPPAEEWEDVVIPSDYNLGCSHPNWYRSSYDSMMKTLGPPFNKVSQIILNSKLDTFVGGTPTPTPTFTPTPSPSPTPSPGPTPATETLNLTPSADSHVRKDKPTTNYGLQAAIKVDSKTIPFMKFNLTPLSGKTIKSAKLKLKVSDPTTQTLRLRKAVDLNWSETVITYNTRPSFEALIKTFRASNQDQTVELDIKNAVDSRKGGRLTVGISSGGNDSGAFYSKESASANRPQLIVEYQ